MKNSLLKKENQIIRILETQDDKVLVIPCTKKSMPKWIDKTLLQNYISCTEEELLSATNTVLFDLDTLDNKSKKTAHQRYTLVASILPFIGNKNYRNYAIDKISADSNISKQTIRHYLCQYLIYQNISILAPKQLT